MSDCAEEEYKCSIAQYNNHNNLAAAMNHHEDDDENVEVAAAAAKSANNADERVADMSESESIESSIIGDDEEESEYDEEAQWREEHIKLQQIFEKRDQRTSCISGSKVKLPYEMLINKLIDGLDTPDLVQKKELPIPAGLQSIPAPT